MHGLKVCRTPAYYVNPHSESILELGTRAHPYKNLNMVLYELFNFISGVEINVTVRLSKISDHEFYHGHSILYNMSGVTFEPYNINLKSNSTSAQYGKIHHLTHHISRLHHKSDVIRQRPR